MKKEGSAISQKDLMAAAQLRTYNELVNPEPAAS